MTSRAFQAQISYRNLRHFFFVRVREQPSTGDGRKRQTLCAAHPRRLKERIRKDRDDENDGLTRIKLSPISSRLNRACVNYNKLTRHIHAGLSNAQGRAFEALRNNYGTSTMTGDNSTIRRIITLAKR